MVIAFFLAFLAAFANAASSLLQRKANKDGGKRPLVRQPLWLLGVGVALVSFALQAWALRLGSLAAIEPLLALELVLVVMGSGLFFGAHIGKQEWVSITLMTVGTIGLLVALNPQEQDHVVISAWQWTGALVISGAVIAVCAAASRLVNRASYRAALLGISTGVSLGLTSSLLKDAMLVIKQSGIGSLLSTWELYVALAVGIFTFWLLQQALHAGKLVASQPGITLADPFVAIAWGGFIYEEKMNGGIAIFFAVLAALLLVAGAVVLARSPVLQNSR